MTLTPCKCACTVDDSMTQLTDVTIIRNNMYINRVPVEVLILGRKEQHSEHAADPQQQASLKNTNYWKQSYKF